MIQKIIDFVEGNFKMMLDERFDKLPLHTKEQVTYRVNICKDSCISEGKCEKCKCKVPGKLYSTVSCNKGEKFPNLMNKDQWEDFKKKKKIVIKNV